MRKFKSAIPDGGLKFFNKFLAKELSEEIFDALQSIFDDFKDNTEGFIIKGGEVTGASPNAQIEESIAILNGKFLRLEAETNLTYPFYIVEATTETINGDFNDNISRGIIDNEFAEIIGSAPVSGQYVEVTGSGNVSTGLNEMISGKVNIDGSTPFTGNQSMGSNKLTSLSSGTNNGDAVNKSQLDAVKNENNSSALYDSNGSIIVIEDTGVTPEVPSKIYPKLDVLPASLGPSGLNFAVLLIGTIQLRANDGNPATATISITRSLDSGVTFPITIQQIEVQFEEAWCGFSVFGKTNITDDNTSFRIEVNSTAGGNHFISTGHALQCVAINSYS